MTGLLARLGIGGFYHYGINNSVATGIDIRGPYRTRRAAEGPTWEDRLYGLHQEVHFHFWAPARAIAPPCFEEQDI